MPPKNLLELISEYNNVQHLKLIHRNPLHSYALTMRIREIKETISFTIAMKKNKIKYLGINLLKKNTCVQKTIKH